MRQGKCYGHFEKSTRQSFSKNGKSYFLHILVFTYLMGLLLGRDENLQTGGNIIGGV